MKKRTLWMSLALILVMALAVNVFAGMGRGMNRGKGPAGTPGMNCNLTDEQLALIQPERERYMEATRELRQNMFDTRLELQAELSKDNSDPAAVAALQAALAQFKSDFMVLRGEHIENIRTMLPDVNMECMQGMRGMHGRGMRGISGEDMPCGMRGMPGRVLGDCPMMTP